MSRFFFTVICSCFITAGLVLPALSAETSGGIPVPDFESWTLSGPGKRISSSVLEVSGTGKESSVWRSPTVPLDPKAYYRYDVSFIGRGNEGGCLPCGLNSFSRDYRSKKEQWTDESFCFQLQDGVKETVLRVGQWESTGTFQFRNVALIPVIPILSECDLISDTQKAALILGDGETVRDGVYRFSAWLGTSNTNIHRPLLSSNATFNSNRWCLSDGSLVVYRFSLQPRSEGKTLPSILFEDATIQVGVCHYAGEQPGVVEVSRDGETRWTELGKLDKTGTHQFTVPSIAFPLENIYVRIRGTEKSNFQVESLIVEAPLEKKYKPGTENQVFDLKKFNAVGQTLMAARSNTAAAPSALLSLTSDGKIRVVEKSDTGSPKENLIPLTFSPSPGKREQKFKVGQATYSVQIQTHPLHRSDYGFFVASNSSATAWWAEADWKISQTRPVPDSGTKKPISISAAKNDIEAFQFVIRSPENKAIKGLSGTVSALEGPGGATIAAANVELLHAYYHFVHAKTDDTGLIDYWPDALPPLDKPIDVAPGKNQPIWISVKVPADAAPGEYRGTFRLRSQDGTFDMETPYTVRVWNFSLPKENHHETAYGFSPGLAAQYHNAKTDEDRRCVIEMYLQCFSDHRISIYNPVPYDTFSVKWLPDKDDASKSKCEIDFSRYDAEMSRVLGKYHFTNFTVPGHGLGGGTFHARTEPSLAGFAVDTPQYKAMMTSYYTQLVNHLKEKGWLDKSYVYWFDEPGKHDYEFVAAGTARLEHYAPELARMMTLMMKDRGFLDEMEKIGTSIDIWCPVTYSFDDELAQERMKKGERFWWYVCTGPKAPYCTLFIDHPATELRVWHWQGWQRGIVGSLIWQSNYWHSDVAFPRGHQNPYEDPMGYVTGYSTPVGTKRHWGNGDGRFIYPPLSAAVPGLNEGKPNFDKPVSSIRWAMIREGVEDYEMLYLLRELLKSKGSQLSDAQRKSAEELLSVPESITKTMTDFIIDPRPLLQRRSEIAKMVETLNER